jgi:hypothetical protein
VGSDFCGHFAETLCKIFDFVRNSDVKDVVMVISKICTEKREDCL